MRVLIVSHNVFCQTTNMGKTMLSYFRDFHPDEVAQLYVHSEVPTDGTVCCSYYRMTDKEAVKSILRLKKYGTRFGKKDIQPRRDNCRTDTGVTRELYRMGGKRTALVYALRNAVWKLSRWDTPELWFWVDDFKPDAVFFVSGDYSFIYNIAARIADHVGKPLVTVCVDDYYFYNRNENSVLGRLVYRSYMKAVHKTMARSSMILTICEPMKKKYEQIFGKPCRVLHTSAVCRELDFTSDAQSIAYIGNLEYQRHLQLVDMGRALLPLGRWIDVYSMEDDPEIVKLLVPENGIRFHGAISADRVMEVMSGCMAVIHTESFDQKMQNIVRFSISTKVAESLMYGPCLIAYGPEGVASIDYLRSSGAAYVLTSKENLAAGLERLVSDPQLRQTIVARARQVAAENHSPGVNAVNVRKWLTEVCEAGK